MRTACQSRVARRRSESVVLLPSVWMVLMMMGCGWSTMSEKPRRDHRSRSRLLNRARVLTQRGEKNVFVQDNIVRVLIDHLNRDACCNVENSTGVPLSLVLRFSSSGGLCQCFQSHPGVSEEILRLCRPGIAKQQRLARQRTTLNEPDERPADVT